MAPKGKGRSIEAPERVLEDSASCSCVSDPYASLPSELRPRPQPKKGGLRQAICPTCGQEYWTNRKTDVCISCEHS